MFRSLVALALLVSASTASADDKDKPKPNTLTPKEIAGGWILLFDGESTFGWKIDGAAEVKNGALVLGKGKKTVAYPANTFGDSFEYELEVRGVGRVVSHQGETKVTKASDRWAPVRYYQTGSRSGGGTTGGSGLETSGETSTRPELSIGSLFLETDGKSELSIRSLKIRPTAATPLFTGKNLDGWKVNQADPKRAASKWDVTKDGELSVKNGPGDLVTDKEFDNFVLQFECKTLGKALNSGIFFRCIPGQYQNGYEAQVQNAYKDDDRTKPADFGTGAIYRRIPARKVVSNDNEWFTMTVVANGKHISTWVNGYQTVDWLDDRKASDNPRQGYRAAKGPLSIQGHDPTTDILFRNIRVAELP